MSKLEKQHATVFASDMEEGRMNIFWHALVGVFIPFAAALLENHVCVIAAAGARPGRLRCKPAKLRVLSPPREPLLSLLSLIPNVTVVVRDEKEKLYSRAAAGLPLKLPYRHLDECMRGKCTNRIALRKGRRVLGAACGVDFDAPKQPVAGTGGGPQRRALVIMRCDRDRKKNYTQQKLHWHRNFCNKEGQSKFRDLAAALTAYSFAAQPFWPQSKDICGQLTEVARSDMIIYVHGSAHASFVALSPQTTVVELTPYLVNVTTAVKRCAICTAICTRSNYRDASPTCLDEPPLADNYGALGHGRSQSKHLVDTLTLLGVPAQHVAVPAGQIYGQRSRLGERLTNGLGFSSWGCLRPAKLALLAASRHERSWREQMMIEENRRRRQSQLLGLPRATPIVGFPKARPKGAVLRTDGGGGLGDPLPPSVRMYYGN